MAVGWALAGRGLTTSNFEIMTFGLVGLRLAWPNQIPILIGWWAAAGCGWHEPTSHFPPPAVSS